MSSNTTWEKLFNAVRTLATVDAPVKERLVLLGGS